jgi:hypothetical protein
MGERADGEGGGGQASNGEGLRQALPALADADF